MNIIYIEQLPLIWEGIKKKRKEKKKREDERKKGREGEREREREEGKMTDGEAGGPDNDRRRSNGTRR